ncbi:transient receptor potential cation channel subfamily A member 1 [Spatholobus suberectus]|nr:transient receptor potential cation channel subfamily A member 1 [Spatholobus suberectus]
MNWKCGIRSFGTIKGKLAFAQYLPTTPRLPFHVYHYPSKHTSFRPCKMNPYAIEGAAVSYEDHFRKCVLQGKWKAVLHLYKNKSDFHKIKINESRGTALHVAVNDGKVELVNSLVGAITEHEGMGLRRDSALRSTNKRGDTPLHIAATRGFTGICKCIIGEHGERKDLIKVENDMWETPLSRAVFTCQTKTFVYLHHVSKDLDVPHVSKKRNQRPGESPQYDSILHCAIRGEFLDLAIIITHCCPQLLENIAGIIRATSGDCARYFPEDISYMETPQPTAFQILATKPSAFKSGSGLSWWKQIIYYCIPVESLDADNAIKSYMAKVDKFEDLEHKVTILSENGVKKTHTFVVPNCATSVQFVKRIVRLAFKGLSLSRLGVTVKDLKAIKKIKQNHKWSGQLLNVFMEEAPYDWYKEDGGV